MRPTIVRNVKTAGLAAIVVFAFGIGLTQGQAQGRKLEIQVPHAFTVASKQMPAGKYTFSVDKDLLLVQSDGNAAVRVMIVTRLSGPQAFMQGESLIFDKTSQGEILSEVWLSGDQGVLVHSVPQGDARDVLSFSALSQTARASGKTAFDLTCAQCHGKDGRGNVQADHFFKTAIPRLASAQVQSYSDAKLREIITNGTAIMPPVEVEESSFRHRLPSQDVDAVIAYVHTLKQ
jgi:mono/diheme cytochrome c family protein